MIVLFAAFGASKPTYVIARIIVDGLRLSAV
jgi:hypothetical protein